MAKDDNKIVKYRKPFKINIVMIIFAVIAVYVIIGLVGYIKSKPITGYEVKEGSLSVSNFYTGIALRDEEIVKSTDAGYVNYYAREGEKVACGDLVYSVDGSGKLMDILTNEGENTVLSEEDLSEIKDQIVRFSKEFDSDHFSSVYDFKYDLQGTSLKLANLNILSNINSGQTQGLANVKMRNSAKSGYIVYNTDGFEELTPADITKDSFDEDNYEKIQYINNTLVESDDIVYKYVNSEDWQIVIPIEEDRAAELEEAGYVKVKFIKSQTESWAKTQIQRNNKDVFCVLSLNNSVVSFCTDRFIEIELKTEADSGLKIPNSAIAEKEFFLIPKEYCLGVNQADSTYKFLKESFMEDGTKTTETKDLTVYGENETDYYIATEGLNVGDYFIKENSENKFALSKKGSLIGVYNINKGYADFRQITIMYQNEDYAIVKSNSNYGLNAYDYIAYDATTVSEDDLIYE